MAGVNKVIALGNLGRDPEVKYLEGGTAVANFSMAVTESWKGKDGEKQERTEWIKVVCFGRLAEICGEYLYKGSQIYLEGRIQTREWEDKEGVKKYITEVVMSNMTMLGGGPRTEKAETKKEDMPAF